MTGWWFVFVVTAAYAIGVIAGYVAGYVAHHRKVQRAIIDGKLQIEIKPS